MLRNTLYYGIKPLMPQSFRRRVRRWFAVRQRREVNHLWPILPGSERTPRGWPGWPEGKTFAFVLTHDVEGQTGMDRWRQLMECDREFGFRSSFNLVPEGEYEVDPAARAEIARHGFEVGVQDLHHDGKLYKSRKAFAGHAQRINHYLKQWGAVGFRAGFMLHNLEWLHDLEVCYDASTFDVDPFEPQPDGVGTIFPFWKDDGNGRGYAELPYTLPQDSTMFLLFREKTCDLWLKKLDWIVQHRGMALLNVHPDYICFTGKPGSNEYPLNLYRDFLREVNKRYAGQFWNGLPREVAGFVASNRTENTFPAPCVPMGRGLFSKMAQE